MRFVTVEGQGWKVIQDSTEKDIHQPERMEEKEHNNGLMDSVENEVEHQKEKDNDGQMESDKQTLLETMQTMTEEQDKMEEAQKNLETEEDLGKGENREEDP